MMKAKICPRAVESAPFLGFHALRLRRANADVAIVDVVLQGVRHGTAEILFATCWLERRG